MEIATGNRYLDDPHNA
jgi:hypothetical protein